LRRREKIFWLVLGAVYIVGLIALIPAHGEICKEGQKASEEACTSYSLLPFLLVKIGQTLDALSVAITALATMAIAWFTWSLRRSTDNLWSATVDTAANQERDTRILQRAYISVEPLGIKLRVDGGTVMAHVAMRNAGNLPARDLSWFINIRWSLNGSEDNFPISQGKGSVVIAPKSEGIRGSGSSVILQELLDAEIVPGPNKGNVYIYVWGAVVYHDGFVPGRETKFCHRYNWIMRQRYDVDVSHARLHGFGNDST
jgi:hypothetical protein